MFKKKLLKKTFFIFLFLISLVNKNLFATSNLILKLIEKSDCDALISLIQNNYKITNKEKNQYLILSKDEINKAFTKNIIFSEYCRMLKTMILFSCASFGIKTLRESFIAKNNNYLYNTGLSIVSLNIIHTFISDFFKVINRYDKKNKINRALAVETLIEKFEII